MRVIQFLFLQFSILFIGISAQAANIIAELAPKEIILDYNFHGQNIIVSCIADNVDGIIISINGPTRAYRIWKKERDMGIWLNAKSFTVPYMISYFTLFSTDDLLNITDIETLQRYNLGIDYENYYVEEKYSPSEVSVFKKEFTNYLQLRKLYPIEIGRIYAVNGNIFRATIFVSEHINVGKYEVNIYGFLNKKMVYRKVLNFEAKKYGLYAKIEDLSHNKPLQYSLIAILIAIAAGAIAGFIFRKDR